MALPSTAVFEVRTAGNDTNGGGFNSASAGTDYSQQNGKNVATGTDDSTTDAVANGTTTITSATANFQASIVGNIIYLQGGTGGLAAGWYYVSVRTNATTITVDRTVAAGTGITMNIGGALASPGMAGGVGLVANNKVWIKAGTYSVTSASNNVSNGCFSNTVGVFVEGYNATRGDLGTKPLIQASGITAFTLMIMSTNVAHQVTNIKFDGAGQASSTGLNIRNIAYMCEFVNFTVVGFTDNGTVAAKAIKCSATGNSAASFQNVRCYDCVAYNNTASPFQASGDASFHNCIADSNSGASTDGFTIGGGSSQAGPVINCVAYNNGRDGFRISGVRGSMLINSIAESNTGTGFNGNNVNGMSLINCATFGNGTAVAFGTGVNTLNLNAITGGGSFFTDAANQDFSLNNTAGAGALCRATADPGVFPEIPTTSYMDVGAAQHQDSGGGGGGALNAAYLG
jgi:hypothetical protein